MDQNKSSLPIDLGDGLRLRRSTRADADTLSAFNGRIHGDSPNTQVRIAAWTRDLLERPHPTFHADDFLVVEDIASGAIVSCLNLIDQTWTYEGIPFAVGRPELVGTDPAYRKRGLVRKLFEHVHTLSESRGQLVQAITGIYHFYRQFGYEMATNLGGRRCGFAPQKPALPEGETEPYRLRLAGVGDIPWLQRMAAREAAYSLVNCLRSSAEWEYELTGKSEMNIDRRVILVIETADSQPIGYLMHPAELWSGMIATGYALEEGWSYLAVTPSVIRYLWQVGEQYAALEGGSARMDMFGFMLSEAHPALRAMESRLPLLRPPYAYYLRVADFTRFLSHIAPVFEERVRSSCCAGHTGTLKLSFYRSGLRLVFEQGRLTAVEPWQPRIIEDEGDAAFPEHSFTQLVFGHRSLKELRSAFPDCWADAGAAVVLDALFPKKPSLVWPLS